MDIPSLAVEYQVSLKVREALSLLVFFAIAIERGDKPGGDECEAMSKLCNVVIAAGFQPPDTIVDHLEDYRAGRREVDIANGRAWGPRT
jgi:hypothetical protein